MKLIKTENKALEESESTRVLSGECLPAAPPPVLVNSRSHKWRFLIISLSILVLLFFGLQLGRQWYDSLMARLDAAQAVHSDQSKVNIAVKTEVKPTIQLVTHYQNGETHRVLVDAEQYSKFVTENFTELEQLRKQLQTQARQALSEKLNTVFQSMQQRIPNFADWYFAYSTTYELLLKAVTSATKNTFSSGAQSLSDAVAYDLQKVIQQQYDKIILQPEITHPAIETAYTAQLKQVHSQWLESLTKVEEKFQVFVKQQTTHVENNANQATLELDWKSNRNKINFADYQKNGTEAWRGAVLAAGGGLTGKVIGSTVAKGIAANVESGLISKLASPFIAKALTIAGSGAVGAIGGPLGVAIGLAGGVGLDYAINKGVALMQRDEFIANTTTALQSSRAIWEKTLQESLEQAIQIWFDDSIQLLPRYDKTVQKAL